MAKRGLENTWVCEHGCSNATAPCKHLEKLISPRKKWGKKLENLILFTDDYARYEKLMVPEKTEDGYYEEIEALRTKLQSFIITPDEEAAVLGRLALNESFAEIGLKIGGSRQYAWSVYKQALQKLKAQGYK